MEMAGATDGTQESILCKEDAVVADVRSVLKELQESIKELCRSSLAKLVTLGQFRFSAPSLLSPLDIMWTFIAVVNEDPVTSNTEGATAPNIMTADGFVQNTGEGKVAQHQSFSRYYKQ